MNSETKGFHPKIDPCGAKNALFVSKWKLIIYLIRNSCQTIKLLESMTSQGQREDKRAVKLILSRPLVFGTLTVKKLKNRNATLDFSNKDQDSIVDV